MSTDATVDGVLRVVGDFDLDRLLEESPELKPDSVWRRGELKGRPQDCGFNQLLFADVRPPNVAHALVRALERFRSVIPQLPAGSAQVDLGVFCVGNCGVILGHKIVASAADLGLGLAFTYYPSAD